jgi:ATP/maltotriose-dependent transcriptional regulator MalT
LQDIEEAHAFVVALDARRSWFRYHHLFADLLQRELRRSLAAGAHRSAGLDRVPRSTTISAAVLNNEVTL